MLGVAGIFVAAAVQTGTYTKCIRHHFHNLPPPSPAPPPLALFRNSYAYKRARQLEPLEAEAPPAGDGGLGGEERRELAEGGEICITSFTIAFTSIARRRLVDPGADDICTSVESMLPAVAAAAACSVEVATSGGLNMYTVTLSSASFTATDLASGSPRRCQSPPL